MKITQTDAFVSLKEARLGLSWFVLCCFLLGASLQIHSEDQGLVLVAPAYGIDKLYFDGYAFKVSFFLFISLDVEKFPYDPLKSCMCACKSIQWQSQMCAGPKKNHKREDETIGLNCPALCFWAEVRIFHQQKIPYSCRCVLGNGPMSVHTLRQHCICKKNEFSAPDSCIILQISKNAAILLRWMNALKAAVKIMWNGNVKKR